MKYGGEDASKRGGREEDGGMKDGEGFRWGCQLLFNKRKGHGEADRARTGEGQRKALSVRQREGKRLVARTMDEKALR